MCKLMKMFTAPFNPLPPIKEIKLHPPPTLKKEKNPKQIKRSKEIR